jgi:hypothetical protein
MQNAKIKSINNVKNHIYKSLNLNVKENVLKNKIYLIDNNYVFEDEKFLIKCPSYDYIVFINVLRGVSDNIISKHHDIVLKNVLNRSKESTKSSTKFETLKLIYDDAYKKYILYKNRNIKNKNKKDEFWKKVSRVLLKNRSTVHKAITDLKNI